MSFAGRISRSKSPIIMCCLIWKTELSILKTSSKGIAKPFAPRRWDLPRSERKRNVLGCFSPHHFTKPTSSRRTPKVPSRRPRP